ncbi:centromere protein C [Elgaria multicarinata webbii]|uniref:centromere protein C n=1 Tax=Elgaria multicarinata webbii TaxID=159646 RepID=UPI002FCCDC25
MSEPELIPVSVELSYHHSCNINATNETTLLRRPANERLPSPVRVRRRKFSNGEQCRRGWPRSRALLFAASGLTVAAAAAAMESLGHDKAKTLLLQRFKDIEMQSQSEELKSSCAQEFTVSSPSLSCSSASSFSRDQDQVSTPSKQKKEPDQFSCLKNAFNIFMLPSPDTKGKDSDESESEDAKAPEESRMSPPDDDVDVQSLGSPALLLEEEEEEEGLCRGKLLIDEVATVTDLRNGRDVGEQNCSATSSGQRKTCEPLALLQSMQRNINVQLEECEFLIEESFGGTSTSWISASQKKKQPQKNSLRAASLEGQKRTQQHSLKRKSKQVSEKLASPTSAKKIKTKLANFTERDIDGLQNASRTNEMMTMVDDQSKLAVSTIQEVRTQMDSKDKASIEIRNKSYQDSTNRSQSDDFAALLEEDHGFSVLPQPVINTAQHTSQSKPFVRQKSANITPLREAHNVACQASASQDVNSEEPLSVLECVRLSKVTLSGGRTTEQLPCSKNAVKEISSKMERSVQLHNDSRRCTTTVMSSELCQKSADTNISSEDLVSVVKPIISNGPTAQQSSHNKWARKKKPPRTKLPKKQQENQRKPKNQQENQQKPKKQQENQQKPKKQQEKQQGNQWKNVKKSVRAARKKNRVLVSDESSESEREEEQCDKWGKSLHKIRRNESQKTPPQISQTFLVSSEDNDYGNVSYQEDSYGQSVAEESFNASTKQQSNNAHSLYGLVCSNKTSSKRKKLFNTEDPYSHESGIVEEDFVLSSVKHKLVLPTNTPNVRRTKRRRIKPLEYWRGERVDYKARPSGGFVVGGIISPEQREPGKPKPAKTIKRVLELENLPDDSLISLKDPLQPVVVFDRASNQQVLLDCVRSGSSSNTFCIDNEKLTIYKYLTTPSFSAGKMILKPLKEKGQQYSHTDTLVFHIARGKLLLTMYDQCYCLTVGDYFFVPPGNIYNIHNLLRKECVILFTQLKGDRSENQ